MKTSKLSMKSCVFFMAAFGCLFQAGFVNAADVKVVNSCPSGTVKVSYSGLAMGYGYWSNQAAPSCEVIKKTALNNAVSGGLNASCPAPTTKVVAMIFTSDCIYPKPLPVKPSVVSASISYAICCSK
jgi:hypothetical protein